MQRSTREPLPLRQAPRCLAKTLCGTLCQSPQTKHGRCRLHGGGYGTGAPKGKANGQWKHGRYSQESIELRRAIKALAREARATVATFNEGSEAAQFSAMQS
jgi:glucans biosynthesis protein